MIDPRILSACDLPPDATGLQIAARMRELAGLPVDPGTNVELWERFLEMVEWVRNATPEPRGDIGEVAHGVASGAIVPPGHPDEDRLGEAPWDREVASTYDDADDVLRMLVIEEIGPRLEAAGLFRLL